MDGEPGPRVSWLWQGLPVPVDAASEAEKNASSSSVALTPRHTVLPGEGGRRLRLVDVQASDAGFYTCVAENAVGRLDTPIAVRVLLAPRLAPGEEEDGAGRVDQVEVVAGESENTHFIPIYFFLKLNY